MISPTHARPQSHRPAALAAMFGPSAEERAIRAPVPQFVRPLLSADAVARQALRRRIALNHLPPSGDTPLTAHTYAFSAAFLARDQKFGDIAGLARRIHRTRGDRPIGLAAVTLGQREDRPPTPAVEINALDESGNAYERIGYAILGGREGREAVEALQAALDAGSRKPLAADADSYAPEGAGA